MYKIIQLFQEKTNKLSFVFKCSKQYFIGDKIILKIDNDIYFAEISKSVYMANSSQHDNFQIHSSNYTATTILEIQKSFLNSSFSVLEFLNNEENRKLLRKQQEESNYI